tara:strand:- start:1331 stop:1531 length:201 start_codon:yes stop_codon:yes gene_type:complete
MTERTDISPETVQDIDEVMAIYDEVVGRLHREHGNPYVDDKDFVHYNGSILIAASNITAAVIARRK